jgi:DnaJ-class molecular chaperone
VLGVPSSASAKDIKTAFRKAALKLHPDVNKAPDAQQQFMEAKLAFETLSDDQQRAEYDRRLRMGFGSSADWQARRSGPSSSSGSGRGSGASYGNYGSYGRRSTTQPEDNYSFVSVVCAGAVVSPALACSCSQLRLDQQCRVHPVC